MSDLTPARIWKLLEEVKDPEIPVLSVVELGIIREVHVDGGQVQVQMSPTFAGCPALEVIRASIKTHLQQRGAQSVEVEVVLSPPWSTDMITPEGREKLKAFGLAPPPHHSGQVDIIFFDPVPCPYCDSHDTTLKNAFGSTLCRAIYYCNHCQQPFEQFKPL